MLQHYFKIALRNLSRYRLYSFINIFGLSVGIAVSLIILLYVSHELSYDKFHANADRIFRVYGKIIWGGKEINMMGVSSQFGPTIKQNNSHVINYVRTLNPGRKLINSQRDHGFYENDFKFSDSSFFSVFAFPLLQGDRRALAKPNTVIISETIARKYFGDENPIGKILTYDRTYEFEVVGVAKDAPSNSSLTFDFVGSFVSLERIPNVISGSSSNPISLGNTFTYLLLDKKDAVNSTLNTIAKLAAVSSSEDKFKMEPLVDVHFSLADSNDSNYVPLFLLVALMILGLALINYMNLTTARATIRAKEVGLRKISGAGRVSVALQFYFESALITLCAFLLAIVWLQTFLPSFLDLLQLKIDPSFSRQPLYLIVIVLLFVFCLLLSGSYPSLVLSGFKPMEAIKGKLNGAGQGGWVRKGFTVFQFTASVALIICTLVVKYQLDFLRNKKIGLDKDQVMVVNLDPSMAKNYSTVRNEIKNKTGISEVAAASIPLFTGGTSAFFLKTPKTKEDVFINVINVDGSFFRTLGMEKIGRQDSLHQQSVFVNESGLTQLRLSQEDLPTEIEIGNKKALINGVIKDFNYESLRTKVGGMMICVMPDTSSVIAQFGGSLYLRLDPKINLIKNLSEIERIFKKFHPDSPFEYYFLDDAFDNLYKSEDRLANIFNIFSGISIFIGCLGLFGLINFTTQVKTKEIGIRKVLGASVFSIVKLLSMEFVALILISSVVAVPIAYWSMQNWLNGFSYKVEIPWWFALMAAIILVITTWATIAGQAIKAGFSNPVDSLRSE